MPDRSNIARATTNRTAHHVWCCSCSSCRKYRRVNFAELESLEGTAYQSINRTGYWPRRIDARDLMCPYGFLKSGRDLRCAYSLPVWKSHLQTPELCSSRPTASCGETRRMHLLRINGGRTLKNWERGFRAPEQ
jgi:hypothetical protein